MNLDENGTKILLALVGLVSGVLGAVAGLVGSVASQFLNQRASASREESSDLSRRVEQYVAAAFAALQQMVAISWYASMKQLESKHIEEFTSKSPGQIATVIASHLALSLANEEFGVAANDSVKFIMEHDARVSSAVQEILDVEKARLSVSAPDTVGLERTEQLDARYTVALEILGRGIDLVPFGSDLRTNLGRALQGYQGEHRVLGFALRKRFKKNILPRGAG